MRIVPLGSGSRGNATLVEFDHARVLVDAGLSARSLGTRLSAAGVAPESIDWILLSHEHTDHTRGAQRFSQRHGVPVVSSYETLEALDGSPAHFSEWVPLPDVGLLDLGRLVVEAFPVPHDAARPVGFVLHGSGVRVGLATDLGHATTLVLERLRGCDALMIESNYDTAMLSRGKYPWQLKHRVAGRMGHLSNADAAAVLEHTVDDNCRAVILAHLSENNNTPDLARRSAARALWNAGRRRVTVRVASARRTSPEIQL